MSDIGDQLDKLEMLVEEQQEKLSEQSARIREVRRRDEDDTVDNSNS